MSALPDHRAFALDSSPEPSKPVLFIMHRRESEPGAVGQWFRKSQIPVDVRRPRFGDPLPETMEEHCGAVIFGGPMSANDSDEYIKREIDWIGIPLAEGKPFLGICLGAQMLARHLGAAVYRREDGRVEVGYEPISPKEAGHALGDWPSHVYHWHGEGFTLSSGAVQLAQGRVFENQAFRFGEAAYGVQFHPEITLAIICRWTTHAAARLSQPGARARAEHLADHLQHGPHLRQWTVKFLEAWLKGAGGYGPAGPKRGSDAKYEESSQKSFAELSRGSAPVPSSV